MSRNVEIKAKVDNLEELHKKAQELSNSKGTILNQEDVFYNIDCGRLKYRKIAGVKNELIFYDRPDCEGPKTSDYIKADGTDDLDQVDAVLRRCLGVRGTVKKVRTLYLVGQTRIHVDEVEGLGSFMELEVCLKENETEAQGTAIADKLMEQLNIKKEHLMVGAYMDLLEKK